MCYICEEYNDIYFYDNGSTLSQETFVLFSAPPHHKIPIENVSFLTGDCVLRWCKVQISSTASFCQGSSFYHSSLMLFYADPNGVGRLPWNTWPDKNTRLTDPGKVDNIFFVLYIGAMFHSTLHHGPFSRFYVLLSNVCVIISNILLPIIYDPVFTMYLYFFLPT